MILWVFGLPYAEARKSSMISPNSGDLFLYLDFHFVHSIPAGALLASSTSSMSLSLRSVSLGLIETKNCGTRVMTYKETLTSRRVLPTMEMPG